jgi:hypothetical protein
LRRRQAGAEKFGAGGIGRLYIKNDKKWAKAKHPYYSSLSMLCRREREFRCSRVYDTGSYL